jgi:hypothetical protein
MLDNNLEKLTQTCFAVWMMRLTAQMAASRAAGDRGGGRTLGVSPSYTSTKGRSSPKAASSSCRMARSWSCTSQNRVRTSALLTHQRSGQALTSYGMLLCRFAASFKSCFKSSLSCRGRFMTPETFATCARALVGNMNRAVAPQILNS